MNAELKTSKINVPKLRFSEFSEKWDSKNIGEVFQRLTNKNAENINNVLTISGQRGLINQEKYFTKSVSASDITGYYLLNRGDFAYNKSYSAGYPVGAIKRLNRYEKGVVSTLYICFRGKTEDNSDFLEKYFDSGKQNRAISKIVQEGARNHGLLNIAVNDFFENVQIYLPIISEQKKIALFLDSVYQWLDKLYLQKQSLEMFKKGMIQKLFSQEIRFKDDSGRKFPAWVENKLGELFVEQAERNEAQEFDLLSVSLKNGVTKQNTSNRRDSSSIDKTNYKVIHVGEIAYNTMRMWQGASGVSKYNGIISPAYTVIKLKRGYVDFYGYLFKHPRMIFDFYRYSQGLTSDTWNLKFNQFSEIVVTTPVDTNEQQKIAEFLASIDNLIQLKQNQIEVAEQWKKGLLQKLFI